MRRASQRLNTFPTSQRGGVETPDHTDASAGARHLLQDGYAADLERALDNLSSMASPPFDVWDVSDWEVVDG